MTLAKPHKYHATKTVVDGITFPSKRQARRYSELRLLENHGWITDLELEPHFPISINGKHVCDYFADFRYRDSVGDVIIEDVKGYKTAVYRLKKKMVEAAYNITVTEI